MNIGSIKYAFPLYAPEYGKVLNWRERNCHKVDGGLSLDSLPLFWKNNYPPVVVMQCEQFAYIEFHDGERLLINAHGQAGIRPLEYVALYSPESYIQAFYSERGSLFGASPKIDLDDMVTRFSTAQAFAIECKPDILVQNLALSTTAIVRLWKGRLTNPINQTTTKIPKEIRTYLEIKEDMGVLFR